MADSDEERLIKPISQRRFELYALSLERGPNFEPAHIFSTYQVGRGSACGCILLDPERGAFTTLALRRRVDHCWVRVDEGGPFSTPEAALDRLSIGMRGGEWFAIEPADILPLLMRAGRDGFIAKNADAFQIVGYDRDAIPEYLGVWDWANLEIDECCPFRGCLCGMHFQDASQMYHCLSCDTLTDFSELDPCGEEPED